MRKYKEIEQGSDEWFELRKPKLTGSILKSIMGTSKARQDAIYEMIAQRLSIDEEGVDEYENPMSRGTRLEPDARTIFEFETGKKIEQMGMCEHDENSAIANSPDGYVEDTEDTEAIEIKCPGGKNYVKAWLTNKVPDEYDWQVVQYFVVNPKLQKLHFVLYNPDIKMHQMHIIEINRSEILLDIEKAFESEVQFLKEVDSILATLIEV